MADIKLLVPKILKWEGGFVNNPMDKGGPTNKGVTIATFTAYRKLKNQPPPTVDDLKNISDAEWMDILRTYYWNKWKADNLECQYTANLLVDWVWASGIYGIKYPQQVLGVTADGIVGRNTLLALNECADRKEMFQKLWDRRKAHFEAIVEHNPSQRIFLKGWLNRLNDYKYG